MLRSDYKFGEVLSLASQVKEDSQNVQFKSIFENLNGGVSILAFLKGQSLSTHLAPAEVMIYLVEGNVEFTMLDNKHELKAGDFLLMGEGVPHSVVAKCDSKIMLIKVKSDKTEG